MVRYGTKPIIVLINNRGYTIEAEIHDGPYNRIKNWDYAGLMSVFNAEDGKGLGLHAATVGELEAAMDRALAHDGPCLIEVPIDPHDCSTELREWGRRVAVAFPTTRLEHRERILRDLAVYLRDNVQAWLLKSDGTYVLAQAGEQAALSAQSELLGRYAAGSGFSL